MIKDYGRTFYSNQDKNIADSLEIEKNAVLTQENYGCLAYDRYYIIVKLFSI